MEGLSGLTEKEVFELRKKFGNNSLPDKEGFSKILILFSQLKSPLIYVVFTAALVSLFFGEYTDAILVGFVIVFNVIMGFFQEYNAHRTLAALRDIIKPKTFVIRDGKKIEIETSNLVPGDLVVLGIGNRIPADGKVVESISLFVREAILTGEEEAIMKSKEDGLNFLFMGTIVASGRGIMEVLKIGKETEIGRIGKSLAEIKEGKTPLQKNLMFLPKI